MITINSERGLVRIESWDDVTSQPGFKQEINPKEVKLDAIIGRYRLPDYVVCGLSNCRHKHFRGYLVSTKEGAVTNLGKDCGKTHFGVDFETLSCAMTTVPAIACTSPSMGNNRDLAGRWRQVNVGH